MSFLDYRSKQMTKVNLEKLDDINEIKELREALKYKAEIIKKVNQLYYKRGLRSNRKLLEAKDREIAELKAAEKTHTVTALFERVKELEKEIILLTDGTSI